MSLKLFVAALLIFISGEMFSQHLRPAAAPHEVFEFKIEERTRLDLYNPWKLDLHYVLDMKKSFKCSFLTLNNLARATESISEKENRPLGCLNSLLVIHHEGEVNTEKIFDAILMKDEGSVPVRLVN